MLNGQEIKDALAGQYGAVTRVTAGQQSLTLYSAIPIADRGRVAGAVLVSQSTFRMLSDLYVLRLDIFRLFLWSVATAIVLSLLVSATITIPIRRLRDQAHAILDPRGRLLGGIVASRARDEVGELSRSLGELTARLKHHVGQMESFASDVSHEFKNPLAAIRSAAEIANSSRDPEERRAMLSMVLEDVSRMERLLTGVREISRIDSGSVDGEENAAVDMKQIAERVIGGARRRTNGSAVTFVVDGEGATAWLPPGGSSRWSKTWWTMLPVSRRRAARCGCRSRRPMGLPCCWSATRVPASPANTRSASSTDSSASVPGRKRAPTPGSAFQS